MNEHRVRPRRHTLLWSIGIASALLAGCGNFVRLNQDLERLDQDRLQVRGTIESPGLPEAPVVLLYALDSEGRERYSFSAYGRPGEFEAWLLRQSGMLLAFADLNRDFVLQPDEPWGRIRWTGDPSLELTPTDRLVITLEAPGPERPQPLGLAESSVTSVSELSQLQLGIVAGLDDERFSRERAGEALWQPYDMVADELAGLYFIEPYDPGRVPVVFVHGMTGTPREFGALVDALDRTRFQPWMFYYPSGLPLDTLGMGLHQALETLHQRYGFATAHLVAHSMGGLVSRRFIGACVRFDGCPWLNTFVSLASPFGGMSSADWGIDHAPATVPAWNDLSPSSAFLAGLFDPPLPPSLSHHLFFAYRNTGVVNTTSSDGVVALTSQLRPEAQDQATRLIGIDATHTGILENPAALDAVNRILQAR
jgi:pimeloyl-ACP methyl ester carboxylesterase